MLGAGNLTFLGDGKMIPLWSGALPAFCAMAAFTTSLKRGAVGKSARTRTNSFGDESFRWISLSNGPSCRGYCRRRLGQASSLRELTGNS